MKIQNFPFLIKMKFAYVNISDIFRQQQRIIQAGTDNYSLFYVIPIVCGLIFSIIFIKIRVMY